MKTYSNDIEFNLIVLSKNDTN